MLHIALWEPEIPPNTGNIARLCAASASTLHLIGRLGYRLDDRSLRRAGLDYWNSVEIHRHASLADFESFWSKQGSDLQRIFGFTSHGRTAYTKVNYHDGDCLLFGGESHGLPAEIISRLANRALLIPMPGGKVRSLNLATATGIALYEALRQLHNW